MGRDLDVLGSALDFGVGDVLKAAGDLGKAGLDAYQAKEAADKASADDRKKLEAAVAADAAYALAFAAAATSDALAASAPTGKMRDQAQAKAAADHAALDIAESAQARASDALPASVADARAQAVSAALDIATKKFQAQPTDVFAKNLVAAWKTALTKGRYHEIVKADEAREAKGKKKDAAPWPAWKIGAAAGGGAVGLGLLGLAVRAIVRRVSK